MAKGKQSSQGALALTSGPPANQDQPLRLKDSILRLLADPLDFKGQTVTEWTPPVVSPKLDEMKQAKEALQVMLLGSTMKEVVTCLKAMAVILPLTQDQSNSEWATKGELYFTALEDIPTDLLEEGCRACMKGERWFPTPAIIRSKIEGRLGQRQRMLVRCDLVIDHIRNRVVGGDNKPAYPDVSKETTEDRVRNMRASFERILERPQPSHATHCRNVNSFNRYETELAAIEQRAPILKPLPAAPDTMTAPARKRPVGPMTPVSMAMADLRDRAQAEVFRRQGNEGMARASEKAIADRAEALPDIDF